MKAPSIFLTLALSLVVPLAMAQQDHQTHHPNSASPEEAATMPSPMQQHLDRMQAMADRMAQTDDPAKRRELMQEYHQAMRETRSMMGAMPGGMGMQGNMPADKGGMGMMGGAQGGMGMMQGGMGMMGGAQGGMGMMGGQSGMMPMMQRMEEMRAGMDKIMKTEDPAKRLELMKETRQQMHDAMAMMRGMQQGGGMGTGMMGGMDMKGGMGMMAGSKDMGRQMMMLHASMMEAYRQMDKRLDLMQMMLEQLMKQQN